ncbi:MAG TPA: hypothetical protein VKV40_16625 [Ktedonobacteraceae bacterium]|nr:hypothetical protein [Ktedonobacteraceae bacterium]
MPHYPLLVQGMLYPAGGLEPVVFGTPGWFSWLAAAIFDLVRYQASRRCWSAQRVLVVLAVSTLIGFLPVPLILPISIQAQPAQPLTYSIFSVPVGHLSATPVRAGFSSNAPGSVQGDVESPKIEEKLSL